MSKNAIDSSIVKTVCKNNNSLGYLGQESLLKLLQSSISVEKGFKDQLLYLSERDKKVLDERVGFLREILLSKNHGTYKLIIKNTVCTILKIPSIIQNKLTNRDLCRLLDLLPLPKITSIFNQGLPMPGKKTKPWNDTNTMQSEPKEDKIHTNASRDWSKANNEGDIDYLQDTGGVGFYKNKK